MDMLHYRFTFEPSQEEECPPTLVAEVLETLQFPSSARDSLVLTSLGLTGIGTLPICSLQTVDLSYNQLTSLVGLETLTKLQSLNVRNNRIGRLKATVPLESLPLLKKLDLRENPVTAKAAYRSLTLNSLKSVQELDGTRVSSKEKAMHCKIAKNGEELALNILDTERETVVLTNFLQKLRVHRQMIIEKAIVVYSPVQLDRFRRLVQGNFDEKLYEDVIEMVIKRLLGKGVESWWGQLVKTQHEQLENVLVQCEDLAQECASLFSRSHTPIYSDNSGPPSPGRVDLLDDCFGHFVRRENDTKAIYSAIKSGLDAVIIRFRKQQLASKVFKTLQTNLKLTHLIQKRAKVIIQAKNQGFLLKILKKWKGFKTKNQSHQRLIQYISFQRNTKTKLKVFYKLKSALQSFKLSRASSTKRSFRSVDYSAQSKLSNYKPADSTVSECKPSDYKFSASKLSECNSTEYRPTQCNYSRYRSPQYHSPLRQTPTRPPVHSFLNTHTRPVHSPATPAPLPYSLVPRRKSVHRHNSDHLIQDVFARLNSLEARLNGYPKYY